QPEATALVIERNSKRRMSDDRIPEAIVLYHVFEDPFEPCAGPRSAEVEDLAEEPELGLERVAVEGRPLGVVGLVFGYAGVDARIALPEEECRALPVVAISDRRVDVGAGLLDDPQLGSVRADLPAVVVEPVRANERRLGRREVVPAGDRDRLARAIV